LRLIRDGVECRPRAIGRIDDHHPVGFDRQRRERRDARLNFAAERGFRQLPLHH
jgi:hypothetical protein